MEILPYSIYADHRPFRIAFLINPSNKRNWFDQIIEFNRNKWGGRFNPIIFTDGKTIQPNWWNFLRKYDPDLIVSTVELDDELLKKIHIFLAPLSVEILKPEQKYIHLSKEPISVRPNNKNISTLVKNFFNEESSFVVFEVSKETPDVIKRFLKMNFGVFESHEMNLFYLKNLKKKIYTINDYLSLNNALIDLGQSSLNVVFPCQVCSLPNSMKDVEYGTDNLAFHIIVGDSIEEMTHLWNRTLALPDWTRTRISHLWIPEKLVEIPDIGKGLSKFVNHYAEIFSSNNGAVNFVTFSLSYEKIKIIANSFNKTINQPVLSSRFDSSQLPIFRDGLSFFFLKRGLELYRAHSEEEYLVLTEPNVEKGIMSGEHWFTDLYIQYRPEKFKNIIGKEFWWQLPKRYMSLYPFFNKPSRINEYRTFSVLMSRRSETNPDGNTLIIKLPRQDESIFYQLICGDSFSCISSDPKTRSLSQPYDFFRASDKGMYLAGILSLFPDLTDAYHWLQERYWRRIFAKMSNQNPQSDEKNKPMVFNLLKKYIGRGRNFNNTEEINWLTEKVFKLAKHYSKKEIDLIFEDFVMEAQKEHNDYNDQQSNPIPFNEENEKYLADEISSLIEMDILLVGVEPRCPHCGYTFWYHIDEVRQRFSCKGCGYSRSLSSQEKWYYRLNSLVRAAFSEHGAIPVLITLGQLLFEARSSFIFIPNIDLYKNPIGEAKSIHDGELDIVCLVDGQFVIGEVKQSIGLFKESDFIKMNEIARLLKPDRIIFSSLDKEISNFVKDEISELQKILSHLEIDVQWYQIHDYVFEPSPVS